MIANDNEGMPTTVLNGKVDQAALLRRLSSLDLPLISVICLETE